MLRPDVRPRRIANARLAATLASWCVAAAVLPGVTPAGAATGDEFPTVGPATRAQAVSTLSAGAELPLSSLTPIVRSLRMRPDVGSPPLRLALERLEEATVLPGEQRVSAPDGSVVRFTLRATAFDRIPADDVDRNGRPDAVDRVISGLAAAREVLVDVLDFPSPGAVEVLLADTGMHVAGYTIANGGADGRPLLVLGARTEPPSALGNAAVHEFAHATAGVLGHGLPVGWGEALGHWTVSRVLGAPPTPVLDLMAGRVAGLSRGLIADDLGLAAGNVLWLSFVEEAYGAAGVRATLEELARGDADPAVALGRAVARVADHGLDEAFREFHLWSVLTGDRDDGRHFSFGELLDTRPFAAEADGMPALSVQSDPPVAAFGAAGILLRPDETEGGMTVVFEGSADGDWQADLVVVREGGAMHRRPIELSPEGRGSATVPLDRLEEAFLLVRSLDSGGRAPYTWSVHRDRGFPFELGSIDARPLEGGAVLVSWETVSETSLVGFNVLRTREDSGRTVRVNPVWVPALGNGATPVSYQFLDATATPGVSYVYRVEGVTLDGLTTLSEGVALVGSRAAR